MEAASFDEWLQFVFDHPVAARGEKSWWWEPDEEEAVVWTGSPLVLHSFLVRLFREPDVAFARFSNAQVAQGLWFIGFEGRSGYMDLVLHEPVLPSLRIECVEAMYSLFCKGFAAHCSGRPSRPVYDETGGEIDMICYMWWDIIILYDMAVPLTPDVDDVALNVLARLLLLPFVNCQEGALHGLNHWHKRYPERVAAIVSDALARATLDPRLIGYAQGAALGKYQ